MNALLNISSRNCLFLIGLLVGMVSCDGEAPTVEIQTTRGVYVINEGNYMWGNGSLTFINPADCTLVEDIFFLVNGEGLGDVPQSMEILDSLAFIVVNNSGKIEVISTRTNRVVSAITGLTSPRYICPISGTKAYVSDLYSGAISVVNPLEMKVVGQIPAGGWTEEMVSLAGFVFAGRMNASEVLKIDPGCDSVVARFQVELNPNGLVADQAGNLWVLCSGPWGSGPGRLIQMNPETGVREKDFALPAAWGSPTKLKINGSGTKLFFLCGGIYQMDVNASSLPATPLIPKGPRPFYGLGVDPQTGEIWVSDALDYLQRGDVFQFDSLGNLRGNYKAGIIPGNFCFLSSR